MQGWKSRAVKEEEQGHRAALLPAGATEARLPLFVPVWDRQPGAVALVEPVPCHTWGLAWDPNPDPKPVCAPGFQMLSVHPGIQTLSHPPGIQLCTSLLVFKPCPSLLALGRIQISLGWPGSVTRVGEGSLMDSGILESEILESGILQHPEPGLGHSQLPFLQIQQFPSFLSALWSSPVPGGPRTKPGAREPPVACPSPTSRFSPVLQGFGKGGDQRVPPQHFPEACAIPRCQGICVPAVGKVPGVLPPGKHLLHLHRRRGEALLLRLCNPRELHGEEGFGLIKTP